MNRSYDERKHNRHYKGMRRIREDRAQHGNDHSCLCFKTNGWGKVFSRFADNPQVCSKECCGNQRKYEGLTIQEEKGPSINDWL
jgi:hypothetical protein